MIIRSMRADFGRLEGETLELGPGLNVIKRPNESGKSTWCAFIRAMLYGIDTGERAKSGFLPDKLRYLPWSGRPMSGSMEIEYAGRAVTLTRSTRTPSAPMREFSAVYTGTAEPLPGLTGAAAGETLGPVMEKCLRFDAAARYKDTKELAEALRPCVGEGDAKAMEMFGKPERELSEVERTMAGILAHLEPEEDEEPEPEPAPEPVKEPEPEPPKPESKRPKVELPPVKPVEPPKPTGPRPEYKVDRDFEERAIREKEAQPKKSARPVLIVLCLCLVIVIAALLVKIFLPGDGGEVTASPTPPVQTEQGGAVETAEPTLSPTEEPAPSPSPTQTPEPSYEIFVSDCSWEEAAALCEEKGGHLVVISDVSELSKVSTLAEEAGAQFVWIGLHRVDGRLVWVTDEDIDYYVWGPGEPSGHDTDGTAEDYVLLWNNPSFGWIYNDSRNDPASAYPGIYGGKLAYVCEYPPA